MSVYSFTFADTSVSLSNLLILFHFKPLRTKLILVLMETFCFMRTDSLNRSLLRVVLHFSLLDKQSVHLCRLFLICHMLCNEASAGNWAFSVLNNWNIWSCITFNIWFNFSDRNLEEMLQKKKRRRYINICCNSLCCYHD